MANNPSDVLKEALDIIFSFGSHVAKDVKALPYLGQGPAGDKDFGIVTQIIGRDISHTQRKLSSNAHW